MIRLIYICSGFRKPLYPAGIRALRLVEALQELGFWVDVIDLPGRSDRGAALWFQFNGRIGVGEEVGRWRIRDSVYVKLASGWSTRVKRATGSRAKPTAVIQFLEYVMTVTKPEAVICSANPLVMLDLVPAIRRECGVPVLLEMRDPYVDHPYMRWWTSSQRRRACEREAIAFSTADAVSFIAPSARHAAIERYGRDWGMRAISIPHAFYHADHTPEDISLSNGTLGSEKDDPLEFRLGHMGREYTLAGGFLSYLGFGNVQDRQAANLIQDSRLEKIANWITEWTAKQNARCVKLELVGITERGSFRRDIRKNPSVVCTGRLAGNALVKRVQNWTAALFCGVAGPFVSTKLIQYVDWNMPLVSFWDHSDGAVIAKGLTNSYWLDMKNLARAKTQFFDLLNGDAQLFPPDARAFPVSDWLGMPHQSRVIADVLRRILAGQNLRGLKTLVRDGDRIYEEVIGGRRASATSDGAAVLSQATARLT